MEIVQTPDSVKTVYQNILTEELVPLSEREVIESSPYEITLKVAPAQQPSPYTDEPYSVDESVDDTLQKLVQAHEPVQDKETLLTQLLGQNTVLTPVLKTIKDISLHLYKEERDSVPQTPLNEVGLTDNLVLQHMQGHPIEINGMPVTLPEILNGGYALDSVTSKSMFSIKEGTVYKPTQVHVQGDRVTAIHPQNVTATVGRAFGPNPVTVFTESWRQANEALQELSKDKKKRTFRVTPHEGPIISEKALFSGVEQIFTDLHRHMNSILDPSGMVNIDYDPDIMPWANSVSTYNPRQSRTQDRFFSKELLGKVKKSIPEQNPPKLEFTPEYRRLISQPDLYALRNHSHVTPQFSDPQYNIGLTDMMLDYVDKWVDHYFKDEFMDVLKRNRDFSKKVFINTANSNTLTLTYITTDPASRYPYDFKI